MELTAIERSILDALCDGECVKRIAERRCRAHSTVTNQIIRARKKLGAMTTYQAVAIYAKKREG